MSTTTTASVARTALALAGTATIAITAVGGLHVVALMATTLVIITIMGVGFTRIAAAKAARDQRDTDLAVVAELTTLAATLESLATR